MLGLLLLLLLLVVVLGQQGLLDHKGLQEWMVHQESVGQEVKEVQEVMAYKVHLELLLTCLALQALLAHLALLRPLLYITIKLWPPLLPPISSRRPRTKNS